jgi:hypothetical protein
LFENPGPGKGRAILTRRLKMVSKGAINAGIIAAEALEIVCTYPEKAYQTAVEKELNKRHGCRYTHNFEVGQALHMLVREGILAEYEPVPTGRARTMYAPTERAGLFLGMSGYKKPLTVTSN